MSVDLEMAVNQITAYFSGDLKDFSVRLDISKLTDFQQKVLELPEQSHLVKSIVMGN